MKDEIISLICVVLCAGMFLMGQEIIPQWSFFKNEWIRLFVFFFAFMTLFYRSGLWPKGGDGGSGPSGDGLERGET